MLRERRGGAAWSMTEALRQLLAEEEARVAAAREAERKAKFEALHGDRARSRRVRG